MFDGRLTNDDYGTEIAEQTTAAEYEHPDYHSLHEALGVLDEEFYEFKLEVYKNARKHPERNRQARAEALDVAVVALRIIKMIDRQEGKKA